MPTFMVSLFNVAFWHKSVFSEVALSTVISSVSSGVLENFYGGLCICSLGFVPRVFFYIFTLACNIRCNLK